MSASFKGRCSENFEKWYIRGVVPILLASSFILTRRPCNEWLSHKSIENIKKLVRLNLFLHIFYIKVDTASTKIKFGGQYHEQFATTDQLTQNYSRFFIYLSNSRVIKGWTSASAMLKNWQYCPYILYRVGNEYFDELQTEWQN